VNPIRYLQICLLLVLSLPGPIAAESTTHRLLLVRAVLASTVAQQIDLVRQLADANDDLVQEALSAWRVGELYLLTTVENATVPILLDATPDAAGRMRGIQLASGQFVLGPDGEPRTFLAGELNAVDSSARLRRAIRTTLDLFAIQHPDPRLRREAIVKLGLQQDAEYLPPLRNRLDSESDPAVIRALREAIAMTELLHAEPANRLEAIQTLDAVRSIRSLDALRAMARDVETDPDRYAAGTGRALRSSIQRIESHLWRANMAGTAFRGLSLGAVLLVAALGLAITFGLMGVINMAHGEIMMVGAYAAYVTQNVFKGWFGESGAGFDAYFIAALFVSFTTAGMVGLVLERGVIQFLYRRPLESLLATWGVSLVLQQLFRHTFGAANVQVTAPGWLSGSLAVSDVLFAYNRLFIIGFSIFIVLVTYLLLTRTSLGLQIRAVMQNRAMASCMGVQTHRVNMLTFAFGSGLAGAAGACLSQITNVGPSLGQAYIIDCFMIVVLGGIGSIVGTVSAAMGVGVVNQILEPWMGAVLGKITVLVAIILFLQWKPAGLFAARGRGLES
jgi:urea transport system permease protein